jgi:hypothetical protein
MGLAVGIHLLDLGTTDSLGKVGQDAVDLVAHLLGCQVSVLVERKGLHGDDGNAFARCGRERVEASNGADGLFDLLGDITFDFLGRGAFERGRDGDRGCIDIGELVETELGIPSEPDHNDDEHEDGRKDRPLDANSCKPLHRSPRIHDGQAVLE